MAVLRAMDLDLVALQEVQHGIRDDHALECAIANEFGRQTMPAPSASTAAPPGARVESRQASACRIYARCRRSEVPPHAPACRVHRPGHPDATLYEEVAAAAAEAAEQFIPRANEKTAGHTSGTP